jgi:hypothetical protein
VALRCSESVRLLVAVSPLYWAYRLGEQRRGLIRFLRAGVGDSQVIQRPGEAYGLIELAPSGNSFFQNGRRDNQARSPKLSAASPWSLSAWAITGACSAPSNAEDPDGIARLLTRGRCRHPRSASSGCTNIIVQAEGMASNFSQCRATGSQKSAPGCYNEGNERRLCVSG